MSRPRPPAWLKRLILPFWNGGFRAFLSVGEYLGAIRHRRFGRCDVCGRFGPWLYQRRVVPKKLEELWRLTPTLAEALATKESSACAWCGAKLRGRRLARVLLDTYPTAFPSASAATLKDWVRSDFATSLRVAEINRIDGVHGILSELPGLSYSDFDPNGGNDAPSEDLTALSYPEASFDLVLTSESLEHVPELGAALAEIRRILKPGGRHLFTVPLLPGVPRTFPRSVVRSDGTIEHIVPEIRHPGGDAGYPVFTEFGADLPEILVRAGFQVEMAFGPIREDDLGQVWICRKPSD